MKYLLALMISLVCSGAYAGIGKITELQGSSVEIKRGARSFKADKTTEIESNDTVSVGSETKITITFADNSTAKISANSKLIIDDFVYDPNKGSGKSAMRVGLGTIRMQSGNIAHNNSRNVNIRTPTATVAVRGTDFAMTVDELGRSTVVLLPTCKDDRQATLLELPGNCKCGAIDVETDVGKVSMDSPFYATYVANQHQQPITPVRVDPQVINASGEGSLNKPQAIRVAVAAQEEKKQQSNKTSDEDRKASRERAEDPNQHATDDTTINKALSGEIGGKRTANAETLKANPCWPFTTCGNERGVNWYEKVDDVRGNVIHIRSGEQTDNTTYNISINDVDVQQRIIGNGGNIVTVRQWNR